MEGHLHLLDENERAVGAKLLGTALVVVVLGFAAYYVVSLSGLW